MKKPRKHIEPFFTQNAGMTFVEVILFLVIIAIVAFPLSRLSVTNTKSMGKYARMTQAVYLVQSVAEQVWSDYLDTSKGYSWVRTNWQNVSGVHNDLNLNYTVQISSEQTLNGVPYVVATVTVTGSDFSSPVSISFRLIDVAL